MSAVGKAKHLEVRLQEELCRMFSSDFENVRKLELVPLMAVMRMIKVEFGTTKPELYRLLITVLHDYNPNKGLEHYEMTRKYIIILLEQHPELADYLISILPHPSYMASSVPGSQGLQHSLHQLRSGAVDPAQTNRSLVSLSWPPAVPKSCKPSMKKARKDVPIKFYNYTPPSVHAYVSSQGKPNRITTLTTTQGSSSSVQDTSRQNATTLQVLPKTISIQKMLQSIPRSTGSGQVVSEVIPVSSISIQVKTPKHDKGRPGQSVSTESGSQTAAVQTVVGTNEDGAEGMQNADKASPSTVSTPSSSADISSTKALIETIKRTLAKKTLDIKEKSRRLQVRFDCHRQGRSEGVQTGEGNVQTGERNVQIGERNVQTLERDVQTGQRNTVKVELQELEKSEASCPDVSSSTDDVNAETGMVRALPTAQNVSLVERNLNRFPYGQQLLLTNGERQKFVVGADSTFLPHAEIGACQGDRDSMTSSRHPLVCLKDAVEKSLASVQGKTDVADTAKQDGLVSDVQMSSTRSSPDFPVTGNLRNQQNPNDSTTGIKTDTIEYLDVESMTTASATCSIASSLTDTLDESANQSPSELDGQSDTGISDTQIDINMGSTTFDAPGYLSRLTGSQRPPDYTDPWGFGRPKDKRKAKNPGNKKKRKRQN